jgi:phosphoribosylaminoimidazole-succinocarboxamide synthase
MVVRGYITGVTNTSLWHTYSQGQRNFGEFTLPNGLHKNQQLPEPVLTPTTKFEKHDRNLAPQEAIKEGLITNELWERLKHAALGLFRFGQQTAAGKGLILVDTKYEFGLDTSDNLVLIDELHTPDSSRYWRADSYEKRLGAGQEPDYYDKEFLRMWYKARFQPYKDTAPPVPPQDILKELSDRYAYVYERLTGRTFTPAKTADPLARIEANIRKALGGDHA